MQQASASYAKVAASLKPLRDYFSSGENRHKPKTLNFFADNIRDARGSEKEGIEQIEIYIGSHAEK